MAVSRTADETRPARAGGPNGALHIGYLVQQFVPEVGAGPARVGELAVRWRDAGARVTVITGMPNRPQGVIHPEYRGKLFVDEQWEQMRVLRSWLYASPKHGFARTLANNLSFMVSGGLHGLARGNGVDVLIASSPPFFQHLSGVGLGAFRRTPLVLELRDLWPDYLADMGLVRGAPLRALFALERALLRRAARVVVVTETFRERVAEKGVPLSRIEVIPNGVDTALYYRADEPPPLPELARRPGELVLGYLGNIGVGQALTVVVDAARVLDARGARVRVVMAGDGSDRTAVADAIAAARLTNVSLHPPVPKSATRAFYNSCDACVVPLAPLAALQDTIPSKIFEIMACERPVVASLRGEAQHIVDRSGCGVCVPPGDPVALANAVEQLAASDPEVRAAMGKRGRAYAAAHYGRDALAARYLDLLSEVAGKRATVTKP